MATNKYFGYDPSLFAADWNPVPQFDDPYKLADYLYQVGLSGEIPKINQGEGWEKLGIMPGEGGIAYIPDWDAYRRLGMGGGSPDPKKDVFEWAQARGLSPSQYQQMTGGLPLKFDDRGYATYDPAAKTNKYSYEGSDPLFLKALPLAIVALGAAGLTGMLPGTTPFWQAGAAGAAATSGEFSWIDAATQAAGQGAGSGTGALSPGNLQWLNNSVAGPIPEGMNIAGATGAPTTAAGEFSLAQPGMGYGGVGSGGTGLALTPGNAIAQTAGGLAQAGGVSLPAYTGAGAGMGAGLGLQIPTGPSLTVPTQKSWMEKLWDTIISPPTDIGKDEKNKNNLPPLLTSGLALADYLAKRGQAGDLSEASQRAAEMADPFADQRKFYQERLRQSYIDPNFWDTDPGWAGIRNSSTNSTLAALAAKGYSQSPGKMMYEIGKRLQDEQMKYALGWQGQLGQFAGAGVSPATAGQLYQSGANLASQERNKEYDALGTLAASLPNTIKQLQLLT